MIKELLEQLAPLDAQIAALRGGAQDEESQMAAITAHASELPNWPWRKMRSSAAAAR